MKAIDLTEFSSEKVLKCFKRMENEGKHTRWLCLCSCGNFFVSRTSYILNGKANCGCRSKYKGKHREHKTRLYRCWIAFRNRCNTKNLKYYGEKGLTYYANWNNYLEFKKWALSNNYSDELTLDRIDNSVGYYPDNCRWVDKKKQANNRTNNKIYVYNEKKYTLSELSDLLNISVGVLRYRLKHNLDVFTPKLKTNNDYLYKYNDFIGTKTLLMQTFSLSRSEADKLLSCGDIIKINKEDLKND